MLAMLENRREIVSARRPHGRLAMIATAWLVLGTSGPSPAQDTGTRIDRFRGAVSAIESEDARTARRVMITFGRCVARNRGRMAEAILAQPLFSDEQGGLARRSVGGEDGCLGYEGELRFSPTLLVGAMAEHFVLTRHRNDDLGPVAAIADAGLAELGLEPRSVHEDVALCIVRRDPAAARALLESRPASDREGEAVGRLVPSLGPCLPAGNEYRLNHAAVRSLAAVGLYRILTAIGRR